MVIHIDPVSLYLTIGGITGLFAGGFLAMTFDISDILPMIGMAIAVFSVCAIVVGVGGQVSIWIH